MGMPVYFQAEWEKRDPRWIVNDRADGTNVNAWHWREKSLMAWSQQRISELVTGITTDLDASLGCVRVTGVKELTGEVRAGAVLYGCACPLCW